MQTNSLIVRLDKKRTNLSKIENEVLDYIFVHLAQIPVKTIYEVAAELFVSTATISRTAKHLGYQGFQELKYAIEQSQNEMEINELHHFQVITQQIIANVNESFQQMDEAKVTQTVAMLHQANTIEVIGLGGSFPVATDFARKLTFLGKKAYARSDWDEQEAAVQNLSVNDLAIFISFTGEMKGILTYATIAHKRQIPVISVISSKGSNLEKLSTITLFAKGTTRYYEQVDLNSRISTICVFDTVLLMYANHLQKEPII